MALDGMVFDKCKLTRRETKKAVSKACELWYISSRFVLEVGDAQKRGHKCLTMKRKRICKDGHTSKFANMVTHKSSQITKECKDIFSCSFSNNLTHIQSQFTESSSNSAE